MVWITTLARHSNKGHSNGPGPHGPLRKKFATSTGREKKHCNKLLNLMLCVWGDNPASSTNFCDLFSSCVLFWKKTKRACCYWEKFRQRVNIDAVVLVSASRYPPFLEKTRKSLHTIVCEMTRARQRSRTAAQWSRVAPQSHFVWGQSCCRLLLRLLCLDVIRIPQTLFVRIMLDSSTRKAFSLSKFKLCSS